MLAETLEKKKIYVFDDIDYDTDGNVTIINPDGSRGTVIPLETTIVFPKEDNSN